MGLKFKLPQWVRVNQGVLEIKAYSTILKSPELEPHHHIKLIIPTYDTSFCGLGEITNSTGDTVTVFHKPRQQGAFIKHCRNKITNTLVNIRFIKNESDYC